MSNSTKIWFKFIVVVFFISASIIFTESAPSILIGKNFSRRYCSRDLSNALELVCDTYYGEFFGSFEIKNRPSGGIVNECCYNPCTLDVMRMYCGTE
ncbi:insulin-like growth factor-like 2 [Microplitis demolitor]|nr:insulin-like growth factor-like 2 [Microplitis demolitor]